MSNLLYKYYKKRAADFLSKLEKAKTFIDITDVHSVRKEIKKLRSLISLFEFISKNKSGFKKHCKVFAELFEYTGRIRELQVNLINIEKFKLSSPGLRSYKNHLKAEESKLLSGLGKITKEFDEQKLKDNTKEIKKYFKDISEKKIAGKSSDFIIHEIKNIKKIQKKAPFEAKYHDIRINLKKLAAISEFLYYFNRDKKHKKFIININRTESKLGNWHDRQILRDSVNKFIKDRPQTTVHGPQFTELKSLINRINQSNKMKAGTFDTFISSSLKSFKK
jgi:CHAD domain-containing protein